MVKSLNSNFAVFKQIFAVNAKSFHIFPPKNQLIQRLSLHMQELSVTVCKSFSEQCKIFHLINFCLIYESQIFFPISARTFSWVKNWAWVEEYGEKFVFFSENRVHSTTL